MLLKQMKYKKHREKKEQDWDELRRQGYSSSASSSWSPWRFDDTSYDWLLLNRVSCISEFCVFFHGAVLVHYKVFSMDCWHLGDVTGCWQSL